jgi:RimJ/RimL family protein N-acetyltransferase
VMAHNEAAHGLYRKCGFIDEGTRRNAYRLDDHDVDEISMGLLLPPDAP